MLRVLAAVLLLMSGTACDWLEGGFGLSGNGNGRVGRDGRSISSGSGDPLSDEPSVPLSDTTVWLSAVVFPQSYDWRRDSSYGAVDARIVLYRNFVEALNVPAYGNAAHDRHHVVSGHLYTEYEYGAETVFLRDGREIFRSPGRKTLRGLLEHGGSTYALACNMSGQGFTLYRDGVPMLVKDSGKPAGGFQEPAFASGGALYEDSGNCVFCYAETQPGAENWYEVRDGVEHAISASSSLPGTVRMVNRESVWPPSGMLCGGRWSDVSLWNLDGAVMSGNFEIRSGPEKAVYDFSSRTLTSLGYSGGTIYVGRETSAVVSWAEDGTVSVSTGKSPDLTPEGQWSYVYPSCGTVSGKHIFLALSPASSDGQPCFFDTGTLRAMDFHGFFTNVSLSVEER